MNDLQIYRWFEGTGAQLSLGVVAGSGRKFAVKSSIGDGKVVTS